MKLSQEYKRRAVQALNETQDLLIKELSYSKDLQKKEAISFYESHILKLQNMISE